MNKNNQKFEKSLMELDFIIHETVLYLDGHPNNKKALAFYKNAVVARQKAYDEYTKNIGPINANDVKQDYWSWTNNPWPWQN